MVSRRRTARIVTKSVAGERFSLWDRLQLWREARRRKRPLVSEVGAAVVWTGRAILATLAFIGIIWLATPWIGGFAPMAATMAMLVLAAKWLK